MPKPTCCCAAASNYCDRCDVLVGLNPLRVVALDQDEQCRLTVTVESEFGALACRACGENATGHDRLQVRIADTPITGRPVTIVRRKRRGRCLETLCPVKRPPNMTSGSLPRGR